MPFGTGIMGPRSRSVGSGSSSGGRSCPLLSLGGASCNRNGESARYIMKCVSCGVLIFRTLHNSSEQHNHTKLFYVFLESMELLF